jgi:enoyl-[acyl-carrier protein] reductase I
MFDASLRRLEGKKGLVIGIANQHSIAFGCAKAFRVYGAEVAITYLNEKGPAGRAESEGAHPHRDRHRP